MSVAEAVPGGPASAAARRLRVFVSTTVGELAAERGAAAESIAGLLLSPVLFELGSRDSSPRTLYQAYVEHSDVFVGVYWQRYGWTPPSLEVSELEDQYHLAADRPRLIYVKEPAPERDPRLAAFLSRIEEDGRASYKVFSTPEQLAGLLADDLAILLTERFETAPVAAAPAAEPPRVARPRLPVPPTPLVGRDDDVAALTSLLRDEHARLVTLTGPGGIGKTRLALSVAAELADHYENGVWPVGLAALQDPALVAPTIAFALGIRESAGTSPFESLKGYLRDQQVLLLLDSFERVASAGPLVADLLAAVPGLQVLITSRALLRVRGEREYPVTPLPVDPTEAPETVAAVRLFLDRAHAANPNFQATPDNVAAVVEICRRLEGVPLAIELAAARTRLLPPTALLPRLTNRLQVLTGGAADMPERQRTLRAAIDWDFDLLDPDEQVLFRRLSVFRRGWTLEAADAISNLMADTGMDALEGLDSLLGKSLIRQLPADSSEPRFGMLDTVREYAAEKLADGGDAGATQRRHGAYYLALAETGRTQMRGPGQAEWLDRLEHEHDNLRAALQWADGELEVDTLLRMCAALHAFWRGHAHFTEGRRWLDRALSLSLGQRTELRARLLEGAGWMSRARGDYEGADRLYREALEIRRELGDPNNTATTLRLLGNIRYELEDRRDGEALWLESLHVRPLDGDRRARGETLNNLGVAASDRGDLEQADDYYRQALAIFTEVGDEEGIARIDMNLAEMGYERQDYVGGARHAQAALSRFYAMGITWDLVDCLDFLAANLGGRGEALQAARIFGASETLRDAIGAARSTRDAEMHERFVGHVRQHLSAEEYDAAYAQGRTMTLEETMEYALSLG
ncbi:MAG TPA: DUF4062 domain-containing protein [Egibacteraceae bacterium]|nr:DUF4062 domain-containing protein [Egibacteraceae bacterium]